MQKNNIRNFICSFLFSVLAVAVVQKIFWHTQNNKQTEQPVLKHEKISLFSENTDFSEDIYVSSNNKNAVDVSDIAALTAPQEQEKEKPELIQTAKTEVKFSTLEPVISTDIQNADEIHLAPLETSSDAKDEIISSPVIYADSSLETPEISLKEQEEEVPLTQISQSDYSQKITVSGSAGASQIAMTHPETLISSLEEPDILAETKDLADADIKQKELGTILDITQNDPSFTNELPETVHEQDISQTDNPWVVAKGNKYAKNQAVVEEFSKTEDTTESKENKEVQKVLNSPILQEKKNDTKLAYQMIQNILIPIPEDILNDADSTPQLSQTPEGKSETSEENQVLLKLETKKTDETKDLNEDEKQSGLFKRISSWFGSNRQPGSLSGSGEELAKSVGNKAKEKAGEIKDKVISTLGNITDYNHKEAPSIMPAELRLSFQPNRAEISGKTLKWIYAFADNARDNDNVYVEVRIDGTSSYALQQKRLNLLSSIFSARGVDYRKINIIFTSREPNSFIIRNIHFNNKETEETNKQR